jgi:hypothetical protein
LITGPLFQTITKILTNRKGFGCVTLAIPDTKAAMPSQFEYDHFLHPATLDGVFQAFFTGITGQQAMLPTSIGSIVIAADIPKGAGAEFYGSTRMSRVGFRNYSGSIVMSDQSWNEPKIVVKDIVCTELGLLTEDLGSHKQPTALRKLCSQFVWKEDIDHIRQSEAEVLFLPEKTVDADYAANCERATATYLKSTISALDAEKEIAVAPHIAKYIRWMRRHIEDTSAGTPNQNSQNDEALVGNIATHVDGRLMQTIGENLPGILDGSIAPLPLMMEDNMLFEFYSKDPTNCMITKWLELQGHKRPDYKILEIGAGTASLTLSVLETLGGRYGATACFREYCFTDTNSGCFEPAQKLLKDWQAHLQYKKLDIECDPIEQGFEAESFDVIVAAHVSQNISEEAGNQS